jgi:hypothetical protein
VNRNTSCYQPFSLSKPSTVSTTGLWPVPFCCYDKESLDVLLVNRVYAMNHTELVLVCGVTAIYLYGALVLERN